MEYHTTYTYEKLAQLLEKKSPHFDFTLLEKICKESDAIYAGAKRKDGTSFAEHGIATAYFLAQLFVDEKTILLSILHDAPKFNPKATDEIYKLLGEEAIQILEPIGAFEYPFNISLSEEEKKVASIAYHKMLLSSMKDIRTIFIKLTSKLHNLTTVKALKPEAKEKIAKKTFTLYAPLSEYIGAKILTRDMQDQAFKIVDFENYTEIKKLNQEKETQFETLTKQLENEIRELAKKEGVTIKEFFGRTKGIYSIFKKLKRKGSIKKIREEYSKLDDKLAYTTIVPTVEDCYKVLGQIHDRWIYDDKEFDDRILKPKPNGYSTIKTSIIFTPKKETEKEKKEDSVGELLEIQIKTPEMHEIAEFGPASHIAYKIANKSLAPTDSRFAWVKHLSNWQLIKQKDAEGENIYTVELFQDDVFAFTPTGDAIHLPKGANALDFAYAVHSQVGLESRGAKINGKMCKLETEIKTGDIVEIVRIKREVPQQSWLKLAKSRRTRYKIKKQLRSLLQQNEQK